MVLTNRIYLVRFCPTKGWLDVIVKHGWLDVNVKHNRHIQKQYLTNPRPTFVIIASVLVQSAC